MLTIVSACVFPFVSLPTVKVMNPLASPRAGTVKQILITDGQPVEYGEPLLVIE